MLLIQANCKLCLKLSHYSMKGKCLCSNLFSLWPNAGAWTENHLKIPPGNSSETYTFLCLLLFYHCWGFLLMMSTSIASSILCMMHSSHRKISTVSKYEKQHGIPSPKIVPKSPYYHQQENVIHNIILEKVNSAKYLGVEIRKKLKWKQHEANSCNKGKPKNQLL